jgi:hypothetical protein
MNDELKSKKYIILREFISNKEAKKLACKFLNFSKNVSSTYPDMQVPGAYHYYNYPDFVGLALDNLSKIENIVESKLFPTYTLARIYGHGNSLPPHVDRPSCEVSISLNLDQDKPWSIWFTEDGSGVKDLSLRTNIFLNPGDAVLYLGEKIVHARDSFEGNYCNQVFLHYIQRDGEYIEHLFDHVNHSMIKEVYGEQQNQDL